MGREKWAKSGGGIRGVNRVPNYLSGDTRSVLSRKLAFLGLKRGFPFYIRKKYIRVNEGTKRD
jgi:hypothetical protein